MEPQNNGSKVTEVTPPESAAGLEGGPGDPIVPPKKEEQAAPAPAPKPSKVYLGGREFNSVDELAAYTLDLQGQNKVLDEFRNVLAPKAATLNEPDLGELMFQNPEEAAKKIEEKAVNRALEALQQRKASDDLRQSFYASYPDLKGQEDMVEMYFNRMTAQKEFANIPQSDAVSKLANAVRSRIASIKGEVTATEELSNGSPRVVGSGVSAPKTNTQQPVQKSMAEQLRDFQKRGSRAAKH